MLRSALASPFKRVLRVLARGRTIISIVLGITGGVLFLYFRPRESELRSISGEHILLLQENFEKWRRESSYPHKILEANVDNAPESILREHIQSAKDTLSTQDQQLFELMAVALVNSKTPMTPSAFIETLDKFFSVMKNDVVKFKRDNNGFNAEIFKDFVVRNVIGLQRVMGKQKDLELVPQLSKIIAHEFGNLSEKSRKPKAPKRFKYDPLSLIAENAKHEKAFKTLCESFRDKISEAEIPSAFTSHFKGKQKFSLSRDGYKAADIKKAPRIIQKFFYKYLQNATKIVDILRCTYVFDDVKDLYCGLFIAIEHFYAANREKNRDCKYSDCVWIKDRFNSPLKNGYRDIILMVRIPGSGIWAEIQFHLHEVLEYKNTEQHAMYELLRHFPNSGKIQEAIVDDMDDKYKKPTGFKDVVEQAIRDYKASRGLKSRLHLSESRGKELWRNAGKSAKTQIRKDNKADLMN